MARIISIVVATCDTLKGGEDTLTKLIDIYHKKDWCAFKESSCLQQDTSEY